MKIRVEKLTLADAAVAIETVLRLFAELGEEQDDLGRLQEERVLAGWRDGLDRYWVFAAKDEGGEIVGVLTLVESFAIYANGTHGIINEMYVAPSCRSRGVGAMLLDAAKQVGTDRGWMRIEVTAPESPRWERTLQFYKKNGFAFTGPKLKLRL